MPVLYSPDDEPRQIPDGEVNWWLRQGYRRSLANAPVAEPPIAPESATASSNRLNLNTASLKDLTALPHIGTALAKKIQQHRPYATLEDAIAKVPEVDWVALQARLTFDPTPNP